MIKVSVIIPVYNSEKYIDKCLESLTSQTLREIELIVVNDGSQDNSLHKILSYSKNDKRINIVNQDNKGVSNARNTGLNYAKGKYIMFVDSDDWIEPNMIESMYNKIEFEQADIVISGYRLIDNEANNTIYEWKPTELNCQLNSDEILKFFIGPDDMDIKKIVQTRERFSLPGYCVLNIYKKDIIQKYNIRFLNLFLHEDQMFNLYYYRYVKKIAIINDIFYNYRSLMDSASKKYQKSYNENKISFYELVKRFIECNQFEELYIRRLYNTIIMDIEGGLLINICRNSSQLSFKEKNKIIHTLFEEKIVKDAIENFNCKPCLTIKIKSIYQLIIWSLIKKRRIVILNIIYSLRLRNI